MGQEITADMFTRGEKVNVTGRTKGRGFSGVVKRYGFAGGRKTHGCTTHDLPRAPSAMSADPARVVKGKSYARPLRKRAHARLVTSKVVDVRPEDNLVLVAGAVPGARGGIVFIEKA